MMDLEGTGLIRAENPIARHETHHVCQTLHARSRVADGCGGPILVPLAEHRVLDEDARTRRPDD
jgi:hypothetical protein